MGYLCIVAELLISIFVLYLECKGANIFFIKKKEKKLYVIFLVICIIITTLKTIIDWKQLSGPWSSVCMILINVILYIYFIYAYNEKIWKKGIYVIIIILIQVITESITMVIRISVFHQNIERLQEHGIENVFYLSLSVCVYLILLQIVKKIKISQWKLHPEFLKLVGIMACINGVVAVLAYVLYINVTVLTKEALFIIMTCVLFCMAVLNIVVFRAMWITSQRNYQTLLELQYMHAQQQQNKNIENVVQNLRQLRHDMNNHIGMLYGLCDTKQYEALHKYLDEMLQSTKQANDIIVVNDNQALSIILNNKRMLAEDHDIEFTYKQQKKRDTKSPKTLPLTELELGSLFGNILDNAIEACNKISKDRKRCIDLMIREQENGWEISCKNTYAEKPVFEGNKLITQKPDAANHGIGTKAMKSIIKKYQGTLEYNVTEEEFGVLIIIQNEIKMEKRKKVYGILS